VLNKILILFFLSISLFGNSQNINNIGFIDDITINGREFENLEQKQIEFYPEDLEDGKVIVEGLLEPLKTNLSLKNEFVEITIDGGKSWEKTRGLREWEYSFEPIFGHIYEFSLRISSNKNSSNQTTEIVDISNEYMIAGFTLKPESDLLNIDGKISGNGKIFVP